jgi:hypothetical protein
LGQYGLPDVSVKRGQDQSDPLLSFIRRQRTTAMQRV